MTRKASEELVSPLLTVSVNLDDVPSSLICGWVSSVRVFARMLAFAVAGQLSSLC